MSCGLGAIVLVFILVKPEVAATVTNETSRLQADLESTRNAQGHIDDEIDKIRTSLGKAQASNQSINSEIARLKREIAVNKNQLAQQSSRVAEVKQSIIDSPIKQSSDVVPDQNRGEEEYLLGLKVEGPRIVFLVDSSASMTDEKLIDIIRRKSGSEQVRKTGPKWLRTRRVVHWLIARLPASSQVSVVSFSDNANFLGGARCHRACDQSALIKRLQQLDCIVPGGATYLH